MANLTIEEFRHIHQDWKQSGQTVRDYCAGIGMKENRFYYWRQKLHNEQLPATGGFVPIGMVGGGRQHRVASMQCGANAALCEVVYPNGVMVRVTSDMTLDQLRQMITLIR